MQDCSAKPQGYVFGRPTEYKPEYCEKVIEWGRLGKSIAWMAASLDVHKDTLYEWQKQYHDFSDALAKARCQSQKWWEDKGQDNLETPVFKDSMWRANMAARFQDDWREKQDIDLSGKIQVSEIKRVVIDPRNQDA